jgi:hypothetical protein
MDLSKCELYGMINVHGKLFYVSRNILLELLEYYSSYFKKLNAV